jgi:hypothetical protein
LPQTGKGSHHEAEGGWSPEDLSRQQQLKFFTLGPDGNVRPVIKTGAVDQPPPYRGVVVQVNNQTGKIELSAVDENLSSAEKQRLLNLAKRVLTKPGDG